MPTLQTTDRARLAGALCELARDAGRTVMAVYATDFEVRAKGDASPVTLADTRAEAVILAGLESIAPGVPVIAEESFEAGEDGAAGRQFFLVDPLDGTREFIKRNDEFTVNIALVEDGVPSLGVIVAPALGRTFWAAMPGEAFEASGSGDDCRPIRARARPPEGWTAVASRSHRGSETDGYLAALGVVSRRAAGSSLKFCLVAAGEADLYPRFGPTSEWDTAAGHAILLHAGGNLCRLDGGRFAYGKRAEGFINPGFLAWGAGPRPPLPDPALWRR